MRISDLIEFLEIPGGDAFDVEPQRAIAYFKAKGLRASYSYAETLGAANDRAFTVAKMMDVDLLRQVRDSLDSALANGTSFAQWRREIEPALQRAGWWGVKEVIDPETGIAAPAQLGSPWRLETIFRTNMQAAYASGQWQEIQAQAEAAPFLLYDAVDDLRTRPLHRAWDNTCLPITSAWWSTHFPPNGWNCRCGVIQLDAEELSSLGIRPLADTPDDGSYRWTNPRTGDVERIPNGIDPGWNRNTGRGFTADLDRKLDEKIAQLPPDMLAVAKQAVRPEFSDGTEAGRWHVKAFDEAPSWVRAAVLTTPEVTVEYGASGAYASMGSIVNMDGKRDLANAAAQSVWRHEFGHILDWRMNGSQSLYRSSWDDFRQAHDADGAELIKAAGKGRKSKAREARYRELLDGYVAVRDEIVDLERAGRIEHLERMAVAAGVDFEGFVKLVRASTVILADGLDLVDVGTAVRIGRMLKAIEFGDAEGFLKFATFKDDAGAWKETGRSWRTDGALASFSDLVGSATYNKVASYHDGYSGHSDAYYKRDQFSARAETFANLLALAGAEQRTWWALVQRFTPRLADLFEQIITEQGRP